MQPDDALVKPFDSVEDEVESLKRAEYPCELLLFNLRGVLEWDSTVTCAGTPSAALGS
jgi:hypothetical protein